MKAFHSKRYEILGHRQVAVGDESFVAWVLRARPVASIKDFSDNLVLIKECKYVDADGRILVLTAEDPIS